jgi:transcriptional regulator with XRE-family HTH domain
MGMKTLAELRIARKLTQHDLAIRLGVSQPAVAGWELGTHKPLAKRWKRIANILRVSHRSIGDLWT